MRQRGKTGAFRADIEGLRALAVTLVVLCHLTSWPAGGFVGVDVFFVISGFLITGQLVRERESTGHVDPAAFLRRRVRRLLPAAATVGLFTLVATAVVWLPTRFFSAVLDGLSALALIANWHFASEGIDYFATNAPPSPFEHFWSLSVEEQFYLFWPALLVGGGLLASRLLRLEGRRGLLVVVVTLTAVSMAWAAVVDGHFPRQGYFDTLGRGWEFGAGALVALLPVRAITTAAPRARRVLQAVGLLVIVASALTLRGGPPIPTAFLPVAATALVIAAGGHGGQARSSGITSAVLWVGRSSYLIYLWHIPVIVIVHSVIPAHPLVSIPITLVLVALLAGLTHRFVEVPARWPVRGRGARPSRHRTTIPWRERRRPSRGGWYATGAVAMAVVTFSAVQTVSPTGSLSAPAVEARLGLVQRQDAMTFFHSQEEIRAATVNAPRSGSPMSLPALDTVDANQMVPALYGPTSCTNEQGSSDWRPCHFGSAGAPRKAVVIGDSIAMSWTPTIAGALSDWQVDALGFAACGPYAIDEATKAPNAACATSRQTMISWAHDAHPDVVFLSSSPGDYERFAGGETDADAVSAWADAVATTIEALQATGAHVVVLTAPPEATDARTCATRLTGIANCTGEVTEVQRAKVRGETQAVSRFDDRDAKASLIDSGAWFCAPEGTCPVMIGGFLTRVDRVHATNAFAESLAPVLRKRLASAGITSP